MFNPINSQQKNELRELIRKHGLESVENHILDNAQNSILLEPAPANYTGDTLSCLGGLPHVPPDWQWPQGLTFLAQINLAEVAPHDHNKVFPSQGLLLFFHDMYDWDESGLPCHVEFIEDLPDGSRELRMATAPPGYLPRSLTSGGDGREIYNPVPVVPRSVVSLGSLYSRAWEEICASENGNDMSDAYTGFLNELENHSRSHRLLGYSAFMDGSADEEAWSATNGVSAHLIGQDIIESDKAQTLENFEANIQQYRALQLQDPGHASMADYYQKQRDNYLRYLSHKQEADQQLQEWTLLFQMDSDDRVGTMFNDAGFAYFMIRTPDLAAKRFDRVYASLWSS